MVIPSRRSLPERTERALLRQVLHVARLRGWRPYHTWTSVHSAAGFPDLVLVRPPRLLFVELKNDWRELTAAQANWLEDLRATRAEVYLWRPAAMDSGEILAVLA